jgi:hypothetical protein
MAEVLLDPESELTLVQGSPSIAINAPSGGSTSLRQLGYFNWGDVAPGTMLPSNQESSGSATYAGGIGFLRGIVLSTGAVTDGDVAQPSAYPLPLPERGVGVEGPNNGWNTTPLNNNPIHDGEAAVEAQSGVVADDDFRFAVFPPSGSAPTGSGDPCVLSFCVEVQEPGFLRLRYVFGSDEFPAFINAAFADFNDSFCVIVRRESVAPAVATEFENLTVFRNPASSPPSVPMPFRLKDLVTCGPKLVRFNQLAPSFGQPGASPLQSATHYVLAATQAGPPAVTAHYYDVEHGAISTVATCETANALTPGVYTVKIVVHDIADQKVDAAMFVESGSLKLFHFLRGDFSMDGKVDGPDLSLLLANWGQATGSSFGDVNVDGNNVVDGGELAALLSTWGAPGGNKNLRADFNRDSVVNMIDEAIWDVHYDTPSPLLVAKCGNRFHGDADNDGDVDGADKTIWNMESGTGGGPALMTQGLAGGIVSAGGTLQAAGNALSDVGESVEGALGSVRPPLPMVNPDANGDGVVNMQDYEPLLDWISQFSVGRSGGE